LVGIKIIKEDINIEDLEEQFSKYHIGYGEEGGVEEGSVLIGECYASCNDNELMESNDASLENIISLTTKLKDMAVALDFKEDEIKVGVFMGTAAS
jgi:hypothetical protein